MIKLIGFGKTVPKLEIHNDEMAKIGDTNDEWIRTRTGISYRRILTGDETLEKLMEAASRQAIDEAKITPKDIDLIIVATFTPTNFTPNSACYVKRVLGAEKAIAFDINSACSGFVYAVWLAQNLMKAEGYKNALVLGGDALSKVTNWEDRSTFVLFGDGCGACVLSSSNKDSGILATHVKNYDDSGSLWVTGMNYATPFEKHEEPKPYTIMDGKNVFKFATSECVNVIKKLVEKANIKLSDVDYFVPHQANGRIIDHVSAKLEIPPEKFYKNVDKYGNTSAASVPMALAELFENVKPKKGQLVMCVAFGGGLTAGGFLFRV